MLSPIAYTLSAQRSVFPLEFSGVNGLGVSGGLLTLIGRGGGMLTRMQSCLLIYRC